MELTREQLTDLLRSIHARPNGTGALLNLIRASEVRAAGSLSCLADVITDDLLRLDVTRHAADEARHAYILVRRMHEIGFAPGRLPVEIDRTEGVVSACRARDPKQLYAGAKSGRVAEFTGVTAPYEPPDAAELTIDTEQVSVADAVELILAEGPVAAQNRYNSTDPPEL